MTMTAKKILKILKTTERPQEAVTGPLCQVAGCDKPAYLRGLCEAHWADPTK